MEAKRAPKEQGMMVRSNAENYAWHLLRAKFDGDVPATMSTQDCFELMLKFGELESHRAEQAMQLCADTLARMTPQPIILEKKS